MGSVGVRPADVVDAFLHHLAVERAVVSPKPLQSGGTGGRGIPLWIAGGGEKVTLKIAAKYASYTNFDGTLEAFIRKSELLREHCTTVGSDFDAIVRSANYNVAIGSTEAEVEQRCHDLKARLAPIVGEEQARAHLADFRGMPACGTPEQIVEKLTGLRDHGMTYGIFYFPEAAYDRSGIDLFEREVIPALT